MKLLSILNARCPSCHKGPITKNIFGIHRRCNVCQYDFHPEQGYYLGAMFVAFITTAILTAPPMIVLKLLKVDMEIMILFPVIQYMILGPILLIYARVLWLHIDFNMKDRLDGN